MNAKEQQRAKLEGLLTPPAQSINNYYPTEQPITRPIAWLIGVDRPAHDSDRLPLGNAVRLRSSRQRRSSRPIASRRRSS